MIIGLIKYAFTLGTVLALSMAVSMPVNAAAGKEEAAFYGFGHVLESEAIDTNGISKTASAELHVSEMSSAQIIDILYGNEVAVSIKTAAKDLALVLTGEQAPAHIYSNGLVEIGTYPRDIQGNIGASVELLNNSDLAYTASADENTITIFLASGDSLSADFAKIYRERLEFIYSRAMEVKEATEGMDDFQKVRYLASFVADTMSFNAQANGGVAAAITNGVAKCDEYSGYFYILALNCGLDVSSRCGFNSVGPHAWNIVNVNGAEYVVDVTNYDYNNKDESFILTLKEQYKATEVRDIWEGRNVMRTQ